MSELETPTTDNPVSEPANAWREAFSQSNITTGLALFAVILAGAPYVVPQVQTYIARQGLLNRPTILEDVSYRLQTQKNAAELTALAETVKAKQASLYGDPSDPVLGNPAGKIRIVEFLDYNCGHCRSISPKLKAYLAANPDVAVVVKEYPVITENSKVLAAYALAAAKLGRYSDMHYALMNSNLASQKDLDALVAGLGLDVATVKSLVASDEIQAHWQKSYTLGLDLGVNGTPTFVVGDKPIIGEKMDDLEAAISALRKGKS
ncbi:MAG: DsbA family protein [Asticcacaulis sp.]|nr:DsbA family protein [Asticcacaulis sp.]